LELSEAEHHWIAEQVDLAMHFVAEYSPADVGQAWTLAALDRAYTTWFACHGQDPELVDATIECVGIAFGSFLVDGAGFDWTWVNDEYGFDIGIRALPERGDVFVCPRDFFAKRWERGETGFLEFSYGELLKEVDTVRQIWETC
jgi:hypothetical protein